MKMTFRGKNICFFTCKRKENGLINEDGIFPGGRNHNGFSAHLE